MHVLLVKDNLDIASKIVHKIQSCIEHINPRPTVTRANITDILTKEREGIHCDIVIFIISKRSNTLEHIQKDLMKNYHGNSKAYKIILMDPTMKKLPTIGNEAQKADDTIIQVANIEQDIFTWWPDILKFLFGNLCFSETTNPAYCIHYVPNREGTIFNPMLKQMLELLKTSGSNAVDHSETRKCCIVVCAEAGMKLPKTLQTVLSKGKQKSYAVALSGMKFSKDVKQHTKMQFNKTMSMELIMTLMADLNIINVDVQYRRSNMPQSCPKLCKVLGAYLALVLNLPAMLMHLGICMVFPWPLCVWYGREEGNRFRNLHIGFVVTTLMVMIAVFVTSMLLYDEFYPIIISMVVIIYLLVWQIGVGITLYDKYNYKFGIFSIPYELAWNRKKNRVSPN